MDVGYACEAADCSCRNFPDELRDSDARNHTLWKGKLRHEERPGPLLRISHDKEAGVVDFHGQLTQQMLEAGHVVVQSFEDHANVKWICAKSELDGYHILPTMIEVKSINTSHFPVSLQLVSDVPAPPKELGAEHVTAQRHWFFSNVSSSHQLGPQDENNEFTGHGYIIPPGGQWTGWETRYSRRPTPEMRRAALTNYHQATTGLRPGSTLVTAVEKGNRLITDLATFFSAMAPGDREDADDEGEELPNTIILSPTRARAARALMAEAYAADRKPDFLMNVEHLRLQFDVSHNHQELLEALSAKDSMLRPVIYVTVRIHFIPLVQEPLPVVYVEEEAVEEEEAEDDDDEDA